MQEQFSIYLQTKHIRQIRLLSNLILFLNAVALGYIGFKQHENIYMYVAVLIAVLSALTVTIKKRKVHLAFFLIATSIASICWAKIGYWYVLLFLIILYWMYINALKPAILLFTKDYIKEQSTFGKTIPWSTLQNVVLKDGLLTLDYKNNKLLQVQTKTVMQQREIEVFNAFCEQQIRLNNEKG